MTIVVDLAPDDVSSVRQSRREIGEIQHKPTSGVSDGTRRRGQLGPGAVPLRAAANLSLSRDLDLMLVGDEATITRQLAEVPHDPARLMVRHGPGGTDMGVSLLANGGGSALVTSGTAGLTTAANKHLNLLDGATAAMCAVYPTARRRGLREDPFVLILDVGVSFRATAEDLVCYARMGNAYATRISRNHHPKVAVLAAQLGPQVGPAEALEAVALLEADTTIDCIGTVGGLDVCFGRADVIVCSGLLGDTVTRLLEGVGEVATQLTASAQEHSMRWRMGSKVISDKLEEMKSLTDWKEYGGAPLLGYDKPILLVDARSEQATWERAIRLAAKAIRLDVVGAVRDGLA